MKTIEITEETAVLGNALGLTVRASDGMLDLTPKGDEWLREWLRRKLSELNRMKNAKKCPDCDGRGRRILNPNWPSGTLPHQESCSTCSGTGQDPDAR